MLNIIYKTDLNSVNGPSKVVNNLIKGLKKLNYPFVLNKKISSTPYAFIPNGKSNLFALREKKDTKVIIGPNLFIMSTDIPIYIRSYIKQASQFIQPCSWVVDLWKILDYRLTNLNIWPTGIDIDEFIPSNSKKKKKVLLYHKLRPQEELILIKNVLDKMKLEYNLVIYGKYDEKTFKEILAETSFILWHGKHESQGIALQESLACNIPILVIECSSLWGQINFGYDNLFDKLKKFKVTTVPYFDNTCGIIVEKIDDLKDGINKISDEFTSFAPRGYVEKNLNLSKQAKELLELFSLDATYPEYNNFLPEFKLPLTWQSVIKIKRIFNKNLFEKQ